MAKPNVKSSRRVFGRYDNSGVSVTAYEPELDQMGEDRYAALGDLLQQAEQRLKHYIANFRN